MKNKLADLNNHMFAQLERLNDEDLTEDQLANEIERSKAVTGISKTIIDNAKLALEGAKFQAEYRGFKESSVPSMLVEQAR